MKNKKKLENQLILLCWLVYTCSYIGRLSYNSNINQIGNEFNLTYGQTGLVTTFFFFAYGIGQVVNGFLCKKYNTKIVIFLSLISSSILNFLLVISKNVELFKYIWLLNGVSMSFLWTSLIKLLSETISKEKIGKAIVTMGTTVAIGTFLVYSLSALFVATLNYKFTFYVASMILLIVSAIWIFNYNRLVIPLKEEVRITEEANSNINKDKISSLGMLVVVLAIFAVANNLIKDGLTVWTPDILDSLYDTPSWLSILLTLCLPILAVFGTALAVNLHKKIKDFISLSTLLYASSIILLVIVMIFIKMDAVPVTIICFSLTSCLMAGVNNIITSMVPLEMKDKINSGKLAGILNGFCYLGSTLSAYGLGKIADLFGWISVFTTLLIVLITITIIGIIFIFFKNKKYNY